MHLFDCIENRGRVDHYRSLRIDPEKTDHICFHGLFFPTSWKYKEKNALVARKSGN